MKAQHQFDPQTLMEQARNILRQNDRGGYTVPTERLYPYQWNWDSAICALGWQSFDAVSYTHLTLPTSPHV